MRIRMRVAAAFAALIGLHAPAAGAAPPGPDPLLSEATDLAGVAMFITSGAPGMVLVVVQGDRSVVRGYGETAKGNGKSPDGASLVRLGSISKVFNTEVLANLVAEGKVRLTDRLQQYAGGVTTPSFGGQAITLLDLATHSAGLPREMGEAPESAPLRTWPTRQDRWKWLPTYSLLWTPGTVAAYSNIGFDLLSDAEENATGQTYADLLRARVTAPLGMADTTLAPNAEQCARLMLGSGLGGPGPCLDDHATQGSGGLYSTGDDIALWLRHNLHDRTEILDISHAVYRSRQSLPAAIGFDEGAPMSGIGLGWVTVAGDGIRPTIITKSGGGAGFMTYAAFAPGRDVAVFVAVNRLDFGMFLGLTQGANGLISELATR